MTNEIRLEQASIEHMTKQPMGFRYALFCDPALRGTLKGVCETQSRMGHIGDYSEYKSARVGALAHSHAALIRFYPDYETRQPTQDFLADLMKSSHTKPE